MSVSAGSDLGEPEVTAGADRWVVRAGLGEDLEEVLDRWRLAELLVEVDGPGGVLQHLDRLDAGQVVEEPAARRVHEQALRWASRSTPAWWPSPMMWRPAKSSHDRAPIEQAEVVVAGRPRVAQQLGPAPLEHLDAPVAEHVEGLPQRTPPRLVPALRPAGVAAAVGLPPLHAVGARPGAGAHAHLGGRGATRRGGRPAAARARRTPAPPPPAPAPRPRRHRRGGGRRSPRRWRPPPARRSRGRRRGCGWLDGASKARAWARPPS